MIVNNFFGTALDEKRALKGMGPSLPFGTTTERNPPTSGKESVVGFPPGIIYIAGKCWKVSA